MTSKTTQTAAQVREAARAGAKTTSHANRSLKAMRALSESATTTIAANTAGDVAMFARSTKYLGRGGTILSAVASGAGQVAQDADSDLPAEEIASRAAYRVATTSAASLIGGSTGTTVGTVVIGLLVPGAGPVLVLAASLAGAMAVGSATAQLAGEVVDGTIDDVGKSSARGLRRLKNRLVG